MNKTWPGQIEWPTIALIITTYFCWFALAFAGQDLPAVIWIPAAALLTTLYWSIVHETVHGHPTKHARINQMLVFLPIGWVYAFGRFRDSHLEHHATEALTDPFDDPESWYLASAQWMTKTVLMRAMLTFNNTLLGRMLIGPLIVIFRMIVEDSRQIIRGGATGRAIAFDWAIHAIGVLAMIALMASYSAVPVWWYMIAAYFGISILLIRTFIEHQASPDSGERTVIIEDFGPLAFLFLYNNFHVVHHTRPGLAWYRLPGFYKRHRTQFIRRNNGYVYDSYWQVFRRYFFKPKEPVSHPYAS
jgi:fatty acid desaturase